MSDDREEPAESARDATADDDSARRRERRPADRRERDRPDEPLGDLAAEVRGRTGRRRTDERASGDREEGTDRPSREGPLADVASAVDERRRERDDADAFDAVDVGELDGEQLWEQLADSDDDAAVTASAEADDDVEWSDGRDVRTISKATCHGCPHFGAPPELACTHEGTDILAMPDAEHFRVAGCPMVDGGEEDIGTIAASDPEE